MPALQRLATGKGNWPEKPECGMFRVFGNEEAVEGKHVGVRFRVEPLEQHARVQQRSASALDRGGRKQGLGLSLCLHPAHISTFEAQSS